MDNKIESTEGLLIEARALIERSRAAIKDTQASLENLQTYTTTTQRRSNAVNTPIELTPQRAGELYASGKTVYEVAVSNGITYGKARQLIIASGTPIRDASARLKGRTRKKASA
ncbi:hypothetical protein [Actinomycetia phage DSL-LC01]|nr:hypothetical protein [Actinomycetia phage DSL-LC01]